jgi:trans-AT polyketide synthase/acyltransferase/oxidoreductase domain-containing protein
MDGSMPNNIFDRLPLKVRQVKQPFYVVTDDSNISFADHPGTQKVLAYIPGIGPDTLGDKGFKNRHRIKYPYIAGAMANGIASTAMVKAMAHNGMIGFFGAGGLSIEQIRAAITDLKTELADKPFGFNLIHSLGDPDHEMATVKLYIEHGIRTVSAAAFMRITPALVYYRVKGLCRDAKGKISAPNKVIAKVSRIEIARQFFAPPPEKIISMLLEQGLISGQEARLSRQIPMAQDLTAEADSGGHTDNRPALTLLPTMIALKDQFMKEYRYDEPLCVGLGGGIATPESAAAAFSMGAAYILTGTINQSCVEAGICEEVKKLLCQAEQADVAMAPAADMFEIGARVQVLKRGSLFPIRAEKLYKVFQSVDSFDRVDHHLQKEIEEKILQTGFEEAWQSTMAFFRNVGKEEEIDKALKNPRYKMALVFRSYLGQSSKWAIAGVPERKMDYQIWCGPAIGAFNQWVKGSFLEPPENRYVAEVGLNILFGACLCLRLGMLRLQGIEIPEAGSQIKPMTTHEIIACLE